MPTVPQRRPKRFNYRGLPVWLQWALPFGTAIIVVLAVVIFVHHETNDTPSEAQVVSPSAIVAQNQEADAVMRQEEAPKSATLKPGARPAAGLKAAIAAWLERQIKLGAYGGPLTSERCTTTAGSTAGRVAFKCAIIAGSVKYPFYGVVTPATGKIAYCQKVVPPVYGMPGLKLSRRCVAS